MFPFPNLDSVPRIEKHIGMPDQLLQQYLVKPLCQVRCSEACNKQITMADPKKALCGAYRFSFLNDSDHRFRIRLTETYHVLLMTPRDRTMCCLHAGDL